MDISFEKSRIGHDTIKVNGLYLHSKYDPILEAERFISEKYCPHHLHIIFGYGLGYHVDHLIKTRKFNEPILIIDPLIDEGILKLKDYKDKNVFYVSLEDPTIVKIHMEELGSYTPNVKFIISINYDNIFLSALRDVSKLVKDSQYKQLININTTKRFAIEWQINYFINLINIARDNSLSLLKNSFDYPVVVASGGPSLTKQIPFLKKFIDKIILICAGSTINSLLNAGIEPHYVVSIDGGAYNYDHFKNLNLKRSQLIYSPMVHYGVRKSFDRSAFVMVPHVKAELKEHLFELFKEEYPIIYGGGSVAHFALSVAKFITKGPIAMIGQDLAYTNNLSHADGNVNSKSLIPNKELEDYIEIEGYYNDFVNSSEIFQSMISTFNEIQVSQPHCNEIFNCTEGGAKIEKYSQLNFEDFLKVYCQEDVNIQTIESEHEKNDLNVMEFYNAYNKILNLFEEGIELAKNETGPYFNSKTVKKLSFIESTLNKLYKKYSLNTLFEDVILTAEHEFLPKIEETPEEEFQRVRKYIISLYEACKKNLNIYMTETKKILKKENFYNGY